jgi:mevalonate kinase
LTGPRSAGIEPQAFLPMARACGKIILFGEHAVVYGVPAIAAGIERGAVAQARRSTGSRLLVGSRATSPDHDSDLGRAFRALLGELAVRDVEVEVSLELPPGCGLGVSATVAVATARAVLDVVHPGETDPARVLGAAQAWERVFHGNPSGIDATTAALGGCLQFVRGRGPEPLLVGQPLAIAVAIAGPPASTRAMVEAVARLRDAQPSHVAEIFSGIARLVEQAKEPIAAGAPDELGQLMDENQMLLAELGVSTSGIDEACARARSAGAFGAKLTGSGGGGAVIALVKAPGDAVISAWQSRGLECFTTAVPATAPQRA